MSLVKFAHKTQYIPTSANYGFYACTLPSRALASAVPHISDFLQEKQAAHCFIQEHLDLAKPAYKLQTPTDKREPKFPKRI